MACTQHIAGQLSQDDFNAAQARTEVRTADEVAIYGKSAKMFGNAELLNLISICLVFNPRKFEYTQDVLWQAGYSASKCICVMQGLPCQRYATLSILLV